MTSQLADLERRIAELERARRSRSMSMILMVAVLALASLGASQQSTATQPVVDRQGRTVADALVAKAVHLVDDSGTLRVLISARAGISLFDDRRRPRAVLSIDATGPGLLLYGETSKAGGSLTVNRDGPALALRDNNGNNRALLAVLDHGPALLLNDDVENQRVALVQRGEIASVSVFDATGRAAWTTAMPR